MKYFYIVDTDRKLWDAIFPSVSAFKIKPKNLYMEGEVGEWWLRYMPGNTADLARGSYIWTIPAAHIFFAFSPPAELPAVVCFDGELRERRTKVTVEQAIEFIKERTQ